MLLVQLSEVQKGDKKGVKVGAKVDNTFCGCSMLMLSSSQLCWLRSLLEAFYSLFYSRNLSYWKMLTSSREGCYLPLPPQVEHCPLPPHMWHLPVPRHCVQEPVEPNSLVETRFP